jgi:hypothetical protein
MIQKSAEAEFAEKLKQMDARHEQELSEVAASNDNQAGVPEESASGIDDTTIVDGDINQNNSLTSSSIEEERLRKLGKPVESGTPRRRRNDSAKTIWNVRQPMPDRRCEPWNLKRLTCS